MTTMLASPRLAGLIRLANERLAALRTERCEMCRAPIADDHRHILDVAARQPLCACRACALLFDRDAAGGDHFRLIPARRQRVNGLIDAAAWDDFGIPVGLAYFSRTVDGSVRVVYPGPAGTTDAVVEPAAWGRLVARDELIASMQPDVEGLLVHRIRGAREQWVVPIDDCYRLVALLRTHWTGFSGGDGIWMEVDEFFAGLERKESVR